MVIELLTRPELERLKRFSQDSLMFLRKLVKGRPASNDAQSDVEIHVSLSEHHPLLRLRIAREIPSDNWLAKKRHIDVLFISCASILMHEYRQCCFEMSTSEWPIFSLLYY